MKPLFLFLLLSFLFFDLSSQNKKLTIEGLQGTRINFNTIVADSLEAIHEGKKVLSQLFEQAYLAASIDSQEIGKEYITFYVDKGKPYKWVKLSQGNINPNEVSQFDYNGRLFFNRPFNGNQLSKFYKRAISHYENNGYPFASITLDSIQIDSNRIKASLKLSKNQFYKIDSIIIKGKSGISETYLLQYLGLEVGSPYNESIIKQISTRIREIPFVLENKKQEVQFFESGVKIILDLKKKKASRFDGVIGLLTNENDGKIELTGDVDLKLINSFNRGEGIGFNWRKLKGNSQDLNLNFQYPYLFKTQFGVDFDFKLFKRDTTFIDLTTRAGISYLFKRGESFTFFLENKSSNLLSRNALITQNATNIPALGDVRINSFGITYSLNRLDYLFNPRKGFITTTTFSVGRKKLIKIDSLERENPSIYNGVDLSTTQYNGKIRIEYFVPIASRSTLKFANKSATNYAENLYQNELLRIGGLKLLRGFDEESINASTYSIFTLEYRFLLDKNSFFSLFSDGGYYENNNVESYLSDTPFGIGAGISFETKAGIFTFNYAVGKQFDNPIEFRAAKVHFGFVNFF